MCPGSSPPSSVPVHKCCETWASRTAPGDLLRWGLGLENGHTTGALAALQDLMWGREGACRSFLTARSQNSPITDPRPSYTPRKLIGDALLRSTKILRQHLLACHLSHAPFAVICHLVHLNPQHPQASALCGFRAACRRAGAAAPQRLAPPALIPLLYFRHPVVAIGASLAGRHFLTHAQYNACPVGGPIW